MVYLIIVDAQNDFITGSLGTLEAISAKDEIVNKLNALDKKNTIIILTQDTHSYNYLQTREGMALPIEHCIEGTDGGEIDSQIFSSTNGFSRKRYKKESFASPELPYELIADGFSALEDRIEIVGFCTDICVVSTALNLRATMPEASIEVDSKCCAGTTPENHYYALRVLRSCQVDVV